MDVVKYVIVDSDCSMCIHEEMCGLKSDVKQRLKEARKDNLLVSQCKYFKGDETDYKRKYV